MSTAFQYSTDPYRPLDRNVRGTSKAYQSVVDHGGMDRDPWGTLDRKLTPEDIAKYHMKVHKFREAEDKILFESQASHRSSLGPTPYMTTSKLMLTAQDLADDPRKIMRMGSRALRMGLAAAIVDAEDTLSMKPVSVRNLAPRDYAAALSSVIDPDTATAATTAGAVPDRSWYDITTYADASARTLHPDVMNYIRGGTTKASKATPFKYVSRTLGRSPMAYTEPNPTITPESPFDEAERNPSSAAIFGTFPPGSSPPSEIIKPEVPIRLAAESKMMKVHESPMRIAGPAGPMGPPRGVIRMADGSPSSVPMSRAPLNSYYEHKLFSWPTSTSMTGFRGPGPKDPAVLRILQNIFDADLMKIGPTAAKEIRYAEVGFPGSNASGFFETPRQVPTIEIQRERDARAAAQSAAIEDRYGFRFADSYKQDPSIIDYRPYPSRSVDDKLLMEQALLYQPDYTADLAERAMVTGADFIEPLNVRYEMMRDIAAEMTHQRDPLVREKKP